MIKQHCDICNKEIEPDEIYTYKLYKGILSSEFFNAKHICFDCYSKIKKHVKFISR